MIGLFQVMISLSVRPRRVIPFLWNKQTITSLHGCVIELHLGQSGIFFKIYPVRVKSSFSSTVWFNRQNLCFKEHTKPWLTSVAPLPERRREESDFGNTRGSNHPLTQSLCWVFVSPLQREQGWGREMKDPGNEIISDLFFLFFFNRHLILIPCYWIVHYLSGKVSMTGWTIFCISTWIGEFSFLLYIKSFMKSS